MSFRALYHGECALCGGDLKDQEATYGPLNTIKHLKCPDVVTEVPAGVPLCNGCFTYHNGECL